MFSRSAVRVTRRAEINPPVLRNDIPCGIFGCSSCANATAVSNTIDPKLPILIPDVFTVLQCVDLFEEPGGLTNVVFLMSVLALVRARNRSIYNRIQRLLVGTTNCPPCVSNMFFAFEDTKNEKIAVVVHQGDEREEESCRKLLVHGAVWYAYHARKTSSECVTILITEDEATKTLFMSKIAQLGAGSSIPPLQCMPLLAYVTSCGTFASEFVDRLSLRHATTASRDARKEFEEYLPLDEVERQVEIGALFRGRLRVSDNSPFVGEVRTNLPMVSQFSESNRKSESKRIRIIGKLAMNRAIHDDVVAVRILPVSRWKSPLIPDAPVANEASDPSCANGEIAETDPATIANAIRKGLTPCGEVVRILEANRRPYCGSLDPDNIGKAGDAKGSSTSVLFQPKSNNIPRIRLLIRHSLDSIQSKRLSVVIDEWPVHCSNPLGHYVDVLGEIGDKDTEAKVILIERDVPHYDFSQVVLDCLPKGNWEVTEEEEAKRLDLRDRCVCSVDPLGCRDIDDALHFQHLPDGTVEVGVHIADVSHFVREGTPIDEEAAKRGTSVYLVDRRINMLPQLLTENLCSIVEGEDRYAFSFVWIFETNDLRESSDSESDDEADRKKRRIEGEFHDTREKKSLLPISEWCGKTIIRSRAALYYGDAQKMIDNKDDNSELADSLRGLFALSKRMKRHRERAGALFLSSQQFSFKFVDDAHINPTDMTKYQLFEANSMVEEWMLFGNVAAARRCYKYFPHCALLRRHEPPDAESFKALNDAVEAKTGVKLDLSSSYTLNRSFEVLCGQQHARGASSDAFFHELVRMLSTRCLKQAQYFVAGEFSYPDYRHFGLAMDLYTHFTSPIRRFSDIVVHRQLAATIGMKHGTLPSENCSLLCFDFEKAKAASAMMNYRHEQAQKAGRDSVTLYTGIFLRSLQQDDKSLLEDGYIIRIGDTAITVFVPKYGQEAQVAKDSLPMSCDKYNLLDKVRVTIKLRRIGDVLRTKLEYRITEEKDAEASK